LRDLSNLEVNQCKYALITTQDGGILSDPILLRVGEQRFWFSTAEATLLAWALATAHWTGLDVEVKEADVGPVQVQGNKATEVMVDLFGESIRDMRHYWSKRYELDGMDVVVSRTGFTNVGGFEIRSEEHTSELQSRFDLVCRLLLET